MSGKHSEESRKDHYEVLNTIGQGSFGKVCKIKRKSDGKVLVWKEMNYGKMSSKEKELVVGEVNILRDLKNPFIVKYYDRIIDREATKLYIVMELCTGGDLGKVVKKCKSDRTSLDEKVIWKVLAQSIVALKDCHRRKENGELKPILHRDIKIANFLLDGEQNIKIADFGLAKELGTAKMAQTNVGTPYYMSPELVNEKNYNEKTDIWSLGCLIYELASLKPPFEASNQVALAMKINNGKYARIPMKYSDALFEVIRSMLHLDPRKRPTVEDFEKVKALSPYLREANSKLREYNNAATNAAKAKQVAAANQQIIDSKLKEISKKEAELLSREKLLDDREKSIALREFNLGTRESEMKRQEQKFATKVSEWKQQQAGIVSDENKSANMSDNVVTASCVSRKSENCPASTAAATTSIAPMQTRQRFKIYQDDVQSTLPPPPPPSTEAAPPMHKVINIKDAGKPKSHDFLKLQHKRFMEKQGNESCSSKDEDNASTTAAAAINRRPPPPPPVKNDAHGNKRKVMNINVPPAPTMKANIIKDDESNKENIGMDVVSQTNPKRQRISNSVEPIKSSTFLAELARKAAQPVVRRIN